MEFQSVNASLPLAYSKLNDQRIGLEEIQILCSMIYRAIYGENLIKSSQSAEKNSNEDCHAKAQKDSLKKLIFEENWKIKQIFLIEEFKMVYQKIFSGKLSESHSKPFPSSEIFEKFLEHFKAQVQTPDSGVTELDIENSKRSLRDLYEEISNVKERMKTLKIKIKDLLESAKSLSTKETAESRVKNQGSDDKNQSVQSTDADSTRIGSKKSSESSGNGSKGSDSDQNVNIFHSDDEEEEEEDGEMEIETIKFPQDSESAQKEPNSPPKRSKPLLKKAVTDKLKSWFLENIDHPYPTKETKEELHKITGLSRGQLQNWFTNARKRFLYPVKKKLEKVTPAFSLGKPEDALQKSELQIQENLSLKSQNSSFPSQIHNQSQASAMQAPPKSHLQILPVESAPLIQGHIQLVQNNSLLGQTQSLPGIMPGSGIQQPYPNAMPMMNAMPMINAMPMMNAPLIQQPYYQTPMQYVPIGSVPQQMQPQMGSIRPISQFQGPIVQPIPQFTQSMPFFVSPTYMIVDPKVLNHQPIGYPQMNSANLLPMQPTMINESATIGQFPQAGMTPLLTTNAPSTTPKYYMQAKPELPPEFAYGYKKINKGFDSS